MSLFDRFKKAPKKLTAHILEPDSGYTTQDWEVGIHISEEDASRLSDQNNLYVIISTENGERKMGMLPKEVWELAKAEYDEIDQEGAAFMNRAKSMLGVSDD